MLYPKYYCYCIFFKLKTKMEFNFEEDDDDNKMRFNTDKPSIKTKLAGYNEETDNVDLIETEVNITDQFGVIRGTIAAGDC